MIARQQPKAIPPREEAALAFLQQDFNQCFEQMRYYDNQIISIFQFIFVAYTFLTGGVTSLYQYFISRNMDLKVPAILTLSVGLFLGIFIFAVILRNRIYFVRVARYINEQRAWFLAFRPLGFENHTRMYTRSDQPEYFNGFSSQSWLIYIVAFLNAMIVLLIELFSSPYPLGVGIGLAALFLAAQIATAVLTLKSRD